MFPVEMRFCCAAACACGILPSVPSCAALPSASPAGAIDVGLIPGDRQQRAFTAGMADNKLYLLDPREGTATPVYDFAPFAVANAPAWPRLFRINQDGTRLFITLNYAGNAGKVVLFDIPRPEHPRVLELRRSRLGFRSALSQSDERRKAPGGLRLFSRRRSRPGRGGARRRRSQNPCARSQPRSNQA